MALTVWDAAGITHPVYGKGQLTRLWDVFFVGPVMIWAARTVRPRWLAGTLAGLGVLTIVFNAGNYFRIERGQRDVR